MKRIDITGQAFGKWLVLSYSRTNERGAAIWLCRCKCGIEKEVFGSNLRSGYSTGCGCDRPEKNANSHATHKKSKSRAYRIWSGMIQRCTNQDRPSFKYYGARGIGVCETWLKFETFFEDMGDPPDGLTLERVDNNAGYSKTNCVWADNATQSRNSRNTKLDVPQVAQIKAKLPNSTKASLAREFCVSESLIRAIAQGTVWSEVQPAQTVRVSECAQL